MGDVGLGEPALPQSSKNAPGEFRGRALERLPANVKVKVFDRIREGDSIAEVWRVLCLADLGVSRRSLQVALGRFKPALQAEGQARRQSLAIEAARIRSGQRDGGGPRP